MKLITNLIIACAVAVVVGLGSVWMAVLGGAGIEQVRKGPWESWIAAGEPDADPYTRSMLARTGRIPLSASEAIYFRATSDSAGNTLSGSCTYSVRSEALDSRWWTLTLYDEEGALIPNPAERYGFNSRNVVRDPDGGFTIRVGPRARSGNWIPSGGKDELLISLRLYDTSMKTNGGIDDPTLPVIIREGCA